MPRPKTKRRPPKGLSKQERVGSAHEGYLAKRVEERRHARDIRRAEIALADEDRVGPQDAWTQAKDAAQRAAAEAGRIAANRKGQRDALTGSAPSATERKEADREVLRRTVTELEGWIAAGNRTLVAHHDRIDSGEGDPDFYQQALAQGAPQEEARKAAIERDDAAAYQWEVALAAAEEDLAKAQDELKALDKT